MEKKLLFTLLFSFLDLCFNPVYGFRASSSLTTFPNIVGGCNIEPPDSFRVVSFSYNEYTLTWIPTASGDDHLLTFFGENSSNGWDSLYSIALFNATSYTVSNLSPATKHKVQIRTVCKDGTLGTASPSVTPPHGVILELVLFGNPPKNPEVVNCVNMAYADPKIKWVGFKISRPDENAGEISNYFQFERVINDPDGVEARLKRVETNNVLVVANLIGEYPVDDLPVKANMLFQVGEINAGSLEPIGFLEMEIHDGSSPSVDICKFVIPSRPWNPLYQFNAIIVREPFTCNGCPPSGTRNVQNLHKDIIKVQNPISEYMNIFFVQPVFLSGTKKFTLLDIHGKRIFREQFKVTEPQIAFPIGLLSPGLYLLQVESENDVQTIKVVIK